MSARKVKGVWNVDFWFQHVDGTRQRVRKAAPVNTKNGAQEYERQLRTAMLSPTKKAKEVRFSEYAPEFEAVFVKANLKYATQITYESTIRHHLVPEFGSTLLGDISGHRVERFKARLMAGDPAPKTVRNTLGVLSRMLHLAKEWGYLHEVPAIRLPKVPPPRFRFLTDDEIQRLLAVASAYWHAPIYFALMTGCRQGEIWGLERDQIDLENASVRIDRAVYRGLVGLPKHDRVRTVDLSAALVRYLREHLRVTPMRTRLVFPSTEARMRQERKADEGLRLAAKRAGIVPFGWHVLRHYADLRIMPRRVSVHTTCGGDAGADAFLDAA